jgi:hypothetical protein
MNKIRAFFSIDNFLGVAIFFISIGIVFILVITKTIFSTNRITITEIASGGSIVSAIPFVAEGNKMQITTEDYIFIIDGFHSIKVGSGTEIARMSDGSECLRVVGQSDCWSINP